MLSRQSWKIALALLGRLPRIMMIVPLAVWLAGVSGWLYASHAADKQALALQTSIPLAHPPREILVKGDRDLAQELAAEYQLDSVYTELHRHHLATAPDCAPSATYDPNRILWIPPKLLSRGQCVISQRAEAPARILEIASAEGRETESGGEIVPVKITVYEGDEAKSRTIEYGIERIPAPLLFPIVGFFYGSQAGERGSIAEMWRLEYPLVPGAGDDDTIEAKARFVASTISLRRRQPAQAR